MKDKMPTAARRPTRANTRATIKVTVFGADKFILISPISLNLLFLC
jgi:hypothetical protein